MAQLKIVGGAVILTSSAKLEDIKLLEKTNPEALRLYKTNEAGKKECVFTVATGSKGGVGPRGVIFDSAALDGTGMATVTSEVPAGATAENVKELVADKVGAGIINLNKVEEQIPDAVAAAQAEKAAILDSITIG